MLNYIWKMFFILFLIILKLQPKNLKNSIIYRNVISVLASASPSSARGLRSESLPRYCTSLPPPSDNSGGHVPPKAVQWRTLGNEAQLGVGGKDTTWHNSPLSLSPLSLSTLSGRFLSAKLRLAECRNPGPKYPVLPRYVLGRPQSTKYCKILKIHLSI